jgi:phospholipid/cholesterol/gamma-HCH transport system substrate-binding protein
MSNRTWVTIAAAILGVLLSSCASISVNSMPVPGSSYADGYDIALEFSNVLNLPDRAKVIMDGTTVGVVTKTIITKNHVEVTARVDRDVAVPSNIHALLQQATVLGDIYVALERDQGAATGAPLQPGGRIPLTQTTSPPQLEDTLANLANFIGSGSIQRAQNTLIGINRVTPPRDEARNIAARAASDLGDLSRNIGTVDKLISGAGATGDVLATYTPSFQFWLSPEGLRAVKHLLVVVEPISTLLPSIGTIYNGGYWLSPLVGSLADVFGSLQQAKWNIEEAYHNFRTLWVKYFLPQDRFPAINITSIKGPDGRELSGNVEEVLHILGGMQK